MKAKIYSHLFRKLWLLLVGWAIILGCSKDEGEHTIVFDYSSVAYEVQFKNEATIPPPTIEWPETSGTFNLKNPIKGLEIDETTGEIGIIRTLNIGEHHVTVVAQNNQGSWETTFTITSSLKGTYWGGGQNNDPNSEDIDFNRLLWLYADGSLKIELHGEPESTGVGVWTLDKDVLKMHACLYCGNLKPTDVQNLNEHSYYEGTVTNNDDGAIISGQWFLVRLDPDSTTLKGNFIFNWD